MLTQNLPQVYPRRALASIDDTAVLESYYGWYRACGGLPFKGFYCLALKNHAGRLNSCPKGDM